MNRGRRPRFIHSSFANVNLSTGLEELDAFLVHGFLHFFRDLHGTELRPAHAAEVCDLGSVLRKSFIVEVLGSSGIETEIELILPAEFETGLAESIVSLLRSGMPLRKVGGVRSNLVGDHAVL